MPGVLSDSHAVRQDRVLTQHQVALGLIRAIIQDPRVEEVFWLDLCCGRGQILHNVENVIPIERRNKIKYVGVDASLDYAREAENRARSLFGSAKVEIIELQNFEKVLENGQDFHVVTMTNSVHEISPKNLATTFVGALCRVKQEGLFFIYDMETLPIPELGAIPWKGVEIQRIFREILNVIGAPPESCPDVGVWPHRSCRCWDLQLHRKHIEVTSLENFREAMISSAELVISELLQEKRFDLSRALSVLARSGDMTESERSQANAMLYDFWAISCALGHN